MSQFSPQTASFGKWSSSLWTGASGLSGLVEPRGSGTQAFPAPISKWVTETPDFQYSRFLADPAYGAKPEVWADTHRVVVSEARRGSWLFGKDAPSVFGLVKAWGLIQQVNAEPSMGDASIFASCNKRPPPETALVNLHGQPNRLALDVGGSPNHLRGTDHDCGLKEFADRALFGRRFCARQRELPRSCT